MIETNLAKLKLAVEQNSQENPNILQCQRMFTRLSQGKYEILVDLKTTRTTPRIWGHIFNKNNKYVTYLVAIDGRFNANDTEELFEHFWSRIALSNKDLNSMFWFPANDIHNSYNAIYKNASLNAAIQDLIHIINKYQKGHNGFDTDDCSNYWEVKQIYEDVASHFIKT